jgi:HK97 family phage portal protein
MIQHASQRILWLPGDESRSMGWEGGGNRTAAGIKVNADTALQCTVVLGCIRVLAESVASLPLHLFKRLPGGGKEVAREHPLYKILHDAPNSWQTSFEWREQQMLHLCLHGNSYSELRSGRAGAVSEIVSLHPSRMKCERIENGRLRYRYREESGSETIYTQDQIMHLRWLSNDGVMGMVPIELARDAIALARACELHGSAFFANGARPGVVLTTDNEISMEAATALRDNWERMHRGADRANRTAVLSGGLKPLELGSASNQESQFLETRRMQTEEVCRCFRIPPHMVGDLSRSSFSNIEQQSIDFVQHTLMSWLKRFETAFSRDLITDDAYFAEFDTRGILRGDAAGRAAYFQTLWNLGVASVNEIRGWENLNPVENGDERFVQLNMQTLGQAASAAAPAADAQPADAQKQPTADVSGLLSIIEQVGAGSVTPDAAVVILGSVYPEMPKATAEAIVAGAAPKPPEPPAAPPAPPDATPPNGTPSTPQAPPGSSGEPTGQPAGQPAGRSEARDCGTGSGGFKPGNKCAGGDAPGGTGDNSGDGPGGNQSLPAASELTKVKNLGGSTGATLAEDKDGNQFVIKGGNSPDHLRSEVAANSIYAAAGVPVPAHRLDETGKSPVQITEYVPGRTLAQLKGKEFEAAAGKLAENFAADALVANWDVIGLVRDNIIVDGSGTPLRIDNGGSLTYRAQGKTKAFGPEVGELTTLRTSDQGKPVFGRLTDAQVASQIRTLESKRPAILKATPEKLRDTMAARLDYMSKWADAKGGKRSESRNCGTGAGGFGAGNNCAKGGGMDAAQTIGSGKQPGVWMDKKGYPKDLMMTVAHAKLYGVLLAKYKAEGMNAKLAKQGASFALKNSLNDKMVGTPNSFTALCGKYGIDPIHPDNIGSPSALKNDPGIYAGEKAMAAGLLTPPPQGANSNVSGVNKVNPPPEPPKTPAKPQEPPKPAADPKAPAQQPDPTKAGSSATPGKPPAGMLPTGSPSTWESFTPDPPMLDQQAAAIKAMPIAKEAISKYTGSDYQALNSTLRKYESNTGGSFHELSKMPQDTALLVASLDGCTRIQAYDKPHTVYRGAGHSVATQLDKLGVGEVWRDTGYVSTSTRRGMAEEWNGGSKEAPGIAMRIRTKYGLNVQTISGHKSEKEVLLPRRSQFRLLSKEWRYINGKPRLYVDLEHTGWHP